MLHSIEFLFEVVRLPFLCLILYYLNYYHCYFAINFPSFLINLDCNFNKIPKLLVNQHIIIKTNLQFHCYFQKACDLIHFFL